MIDLSLSLSLSLSDPRPHPALARPQTDAIMRYIGRKFDMYGSSIEEATKIDMILQGVEDIRMKYVNLIYKQDLKDEAKKEYKDLHLASESLKKNNGGAHFGYLERLLKENEGGSTFIVGKKLSIADIQVRRQRERERTRSPSSSRPCAYAHARRLDTIMTGDLCLFIRLLMQLFELVDLHLRDALFPEEMKELFPLLCAHYERVASVPAIAAYLKGPKRLETVNVNKLG